MIQINLTAQTIDSTFDTIKLCPRLQRCSCCRLCWLARGCGTQSIPSASDWPGDRTPGRTREEDRSRAPPPNATRTPPPRFTSSDARGGRKRSGFVTSCLRPWTARGRRGDRVRGGCVSMCGLWVTCSGSLPPCGVTRWLQEKKSVNV